MIENGKFGDAVGPLVTAILVGQELPDHQKEITGLAMLALKDAYSCDPEGVSKIVERLTGEPVPGWVKEEPGQIDSGSPDALP
jgi:hypothetical protein